MAPQTPTENKAKSRRRLEGVVVGRAGAKTISVEVVREVRHPLYNKKRKWTKRYLTHDEKDQATLGQTVTIEETRPLSRRKRWRLISKA